LEEQGNGDLKSEFKHCFHGKYQEVKESTRHEKIKFDSLYASENKVEEREKMHMMKLVSYKINAPIKDLCKNYNNHKFLMTSITRFGDLVWEIFIFVSFSFMFSVNKYYIFVLHDHDVINLILLIKYL
jgi:hypothetical protein